MTVPIYVKPETNELDDSLNKIKGLVKQIEAEAAFISLKEPTLYAVLAPDNDCIRVGEIEVYGVSGLSEGQKQRIYDNIREIVGENQAT